MHLAQLDRSKLRANKVRATVDDTGDGSLNVSISSVERHLKQLGYVIVRRFGGPICELDYHASLTLLN